MNKLPLFIPYSKPDHINYPFVVCVNWNLIHGLIEMSSPQPATNFAKWLLDGTMKNVLGNGYTHAFFTQTKTDFMLPRTMLQSMPPKNLLKLFIQARLPNT